MENIISMVDHTILKPEAKKEEIEVLCQEAIEYKFAAVCINPYYVSLCKDLLKDTDVKVATVIGFPLGANTSEVKAFETEDAIKNGANEIDMVINIGALKDKDYKTVKEDIEKVVKVAHAHEGVIVKVIIETALLEKEEKIKACELSMDAKADFVKTSTGFSTAGATVEDIELMKSVVGDHLEIKASGGVRDVESARAMIEKGATRLGTSSGVKIAKELLGR
nr:deoxyribose-phosphate aldolase [Tissierella sp.]